MNTVISSKDARTQFAEILNQVMYGGYEFTISRFDKPVAKIVPIKEVDAEEEIKRRKKLVADIRKARKIYKGVNLTKIVIKERNKEYKRWKI